MEMSSIGMIEIIADALGTLKEEMVFVGGSVAELYVDVPGVSDVRPTLDVDCIVSIDIRSYLDYSKLENKLRALGFRDDLSSNAPVCRKNYQGIMVDFMPIIPEILGFTNRWYAAGYANKIKKALPNGTIINILPIEYYLATKIEALNNRGGTDIRGSHDWEDIVFIMSNCAKLTERITQCSNYQLVIFLKDYYSQLLANDNISEIIYCALPYHSQEESIDYIFQRVSEISKVKVETKLFQTIYDEHKSKRGRFDKELSERQIERKAKREGGR